MEISVQCPCGTKYKFEVEPVYGRMPAPVSCPACGADGTVLANESIQATLSAASAPLAAAPAAPAGPPSLSGARLRTNRPASLPSSESPPPPAPAYASPSITVVPAARPQKSRRTMGIVTVLLVVGCIAFGTWRVGSKVYKRIQSVIETAKAVSELADMEFNFMMDDATVLYIRHTNHVEVAQACKDYWNSNVKKTLLILEKVQEEEYGQGQFELWKEHNGFVQLYGGLDWPQDQYEGLAQYLSKRFGTLVFEVRSEEDTGAYHFGTYEQGARKFHAQMVMDKDFNENVTTEGNEWAIANGFKPGPEGFTEFDLIDADKISQHAGLKTWDIPEEEQHASVWLLEPGRPRTP